MSGDLQNCSRARCRSSAREECSAGPHKFAAIPKSSPCNRETPAKSFETVAPGKYYVSLYCIMRTLFALNYISPSLPPPSRTSGTDAASTKWEWNTVFKWNLTARSVRADFRQDPSNEDPFSIEQLRLVTFGAIYSSDPMYPNAGLSCAPDSLCQIVQKCQRRGLDHPLLPWFLSVSPRDPTQKPRHYFHKPPASCFVHCWL